MTVQPDERWVTEHLGRWRANRDPEALGELLKWQRDRAFAVARRVLGNEAEAEDAVQQAFLKLFRSDSAFQEPREFHAAVYRSVTQCAIDLARTKQARRLVEHVMAQQGPPVSTSSPAQATENSEALRILQQEMETLAAEDRALLALCCQEGLSLVAAAESLELPRETARDRLGRLLTDLRKRLARRGVALSLLLLVGLFQQGRACAGEGLCATLDAALPGASCAGIAPAAAVTVSASALLAQTGVATGLLAGKALLGVSAAMVLTAGAITWSVCGAPPNASNKAGLPTPPARVIVEASKPVSAPVDVAAPQAVPVSEAQAKAVANKRDEPAAPKAPKKNRRAARGIPLTDVPANVREAVLKALPGLDIQRAKREVEKGRTVFTLKGRVDVQPFEIEVSEAGQVLKVEQKADEDQDDDEEEEKDAKEKGVPPPLEPTPGPAAEF